MGRRPRWTHHTRSEPRSCGTSTTVSTWSTWPRMRGSMSCWHSNTPWRYKTTEISLLYPKYTLYFLHVCTLYSRILHHRLKNVLAFTFACTQPTCASCEIHVERALCEFHRKFHLNFMWSQHESGGRWINLQVFHVNIHMISPLFSQLP